MDVEVYTVNEVAEILKISREKVYKLILDGSLNKINNIKNTRITRKELDRFMETE